MFKITHGKLTINHFVKVLFKFDDKLLFGFAYTCFQTSYYLNICLELN